MYILWRELLVIGSLYAYCLSSTPFFTARAAVSARSRSSCAAAIAARSGAVTGSAAAPADDPPPPPPAGLPGGTRFLRRMFSGSGTYLQHGQRRRGGSTVSAERGWHLVSSIQHSAFQDGFPRKKKKEKKEKKERKGVLLAEGVCAVAPQTLCTVRTLREHAWQPNVTARVAAHVLGHTRGDRSTDRLS